MLKNKKQYYITEGHIDEDGNEYEKDYSGPFTLNKARRLMEYYFKSSYHFRNPYNLNIRGPRHTNDWGANTEFYSHKETA